MNKKAIVFILLACFSQILWAQGGGDGGSSVRGGGGVSELNIRYVRENFFEHLKLLSSLVSESEKEERMILDFLKKNHKKELNTKLLFKNKSDFGSVNSMYLASSVPGTTVIFNIDALFTRTSSSLRPLTIGEATGLLIEVFLRKKPFPVLHVKNLQAKAKVYLEEASEESSFSAQGRPELKIISINPRHFNKTLIADSNKIRDITKFLVESAPCNGDDVLASELSTSNIYLNKLFPLNVPLSNQTFLFEGRVHYACGNSLLEGKFQITFTYDLKSKTGLQVDEHWWSQKDIEANLDHASLRVDFHDLQENREL